MSNKNVFFCNVFVISIYSMVFVSTFFGWFLLEVFFFQLFSIRFGWWGASTTLGGSGPALDLSILLLPLFLPIFWASPSSQREPGGTRGGQREPEGTRGNQNITRRRDPTSPPGPLARWREPILLCQREPQSCRC